MKIVVTGCAGFIGSHVCEKLLQNKSITVIGIDSLNHYYDVNIKKNNIKILENFSNFIFYNENVLETKIISVYKPDYICHLASMAGVRYSIDNPQLYVKENIQGFLNILDESVTNNVKNLVFASSSSVYGSLQKEKFSENDITVQCESPYACSKLSMEHFAKTYNSLYKLPVIGLRFFTVYGPRGRPDMAPYKFLYNIHNDISIDKYGNGESFRDYTYIDDIVDGVLASLFKKHSESIIYNLGNDKPISLNAFINTCEKICGKKAKINAKQSQLGDVSYTCANIEKAKKELNYSPKVDIVSGLKNTFEYIKNNNQNKEIEEIEKIKRLERVEKLERVY
tara:strand:- start:2383 stop:3396 length:1014 start_codon:yes stop_codon:yes gene_type:complete